MSGLVPRRTAVVFSVLITTAFGCDLLGRKLNPAFCEAHPDEVACRQVVPDAAPDAPPDAPPLCTSNSDCTLSTAPVCDLNDTKMCVQCTQIDNPCPMAMPACVNKQCTTCTRHDQCAASNVCLPNGTCADETKVAYVAPTGSTGECTRAAPCKTLAEGLQKNRPFVKIAGAISDNTITVIDGKAVTILADPDATLRRVGDGVTLEVRKDGADVQIFDLRISRDSPPGSGAAISVPMDGAPKLTLTRVTVDSNQGAGISVSAGTLTMSRCTVRDNHGGGIRVLQGTVAFDIRNSFIIHNGLAAATGGSTIGGLAFELTTDASRFEWNTVAFNESTGSGNAGGVQCDGPTVVASGNLIFHNTRFDSTSMAPKTDDMAQKGGSCLFGNSLAIATDTGTPGNLGFKVPLDSPYDFHLTGTSPSTVVDAAGACSGIDVDGDMRPIGSGCDFGADEYKP